LKRYTVIHKKLESLLHPTISAALARKLGRESLYKDGRGAAIPRIARLAKMLGLDFIRLEY